MQMVANHFHDMYIYSKVTMTCTYIPRLLNFQGFLHSKVTTFPRLPLQHSNQDADPIKMPFRYIHTYVCMTCRYTHILCISCVLYSFSVEGQYMENQYGSPVRLQMLLLGWWVGLGVPLAPRIPLPGCPSAIAGPRLRLSPVRSPPVAARRRCTGIHTCRR